MTNICNWNGVLRDYGVKWWTSRWIKAVGSGNFPNEVRAGLNDSKAALLPDPGYSTMEDGAYVFDEDWKKKNAVACLCYPITVKSSRCT